MGPALAALLAAVFIQIGTNLANDLYDFRKGADTQERLGPTRAVQAGWLSEHEVWIGTWLAFGAAMVAGLYLAWLAGPWLIVVGLASILSGVLYTAGPAPIGYVGLGDAFVFVFFGWVAVVGSCYVQTLSVEPLALLASIPIGALATAILVINNLRDIDTDIKAGKKTLAVRFGPMFARLEYLVLVVGAFLVPLWLYLRADMVWPVLLPMILAPVSPALITRAFTREGGELNPLLGDTAKLLLAFAVLFTIGIVWATVPVGDPGAIESTEPAAMALTAQLSLLR